MDLSLNPSIERFTLLISIEETISNMLLSATITKKNTINLFSKIKKLKFGVIKVDFAKRSSNQNVKPQCNTCIIYVYLKHSILDRNADF